MITIDIVKNHPKTIPYLVQLWHESLGKIWEPNLPITEIEKWFSAWLNESIPLVYVALENDLPVGMCSLQENDGIRPDLKPWLGDLCVDKKYQHRGIGRQLVNAAIAKAAELSFKQLYLFAPDPTIPQYYQNLGWQIIGIDEYHGHRVTVMSLTLSCS